MLVTLRKYICVYKPKPCDKQEKQDGTKNEVRYSIVLNSIQINLFCNCMKKVRLTSKYNCTSMFVTVPLCLSLFVLVTLRMVSQECWSLAYSVLDTGDIMYGFLSDYIPGIYADRYILFVCVCQFVCSIVCTSMTFLCLVPGIYVKATTYQKAFIIGP